MTDARERRRCLCAGGSQLRVARASWLGRVPLSPSPPTPALFLADRPIDRRRHGARGPSLRCAAPSAAAGGVGGWVGGPPSRRFFFDAFSGGFLRPKTAVKMPPRNKRAREGRPPSRATVGRGVPAVFKIQKSAPARARAGARRRCPAVPQNEPGARAAGECRLLASQANARARASETRPHPSPAPGADTSGPRNATKVKANAQERRARKAKPTDRPTRPSTVRPLHLPLPQPQPLPMPPPAPARSRRGCPTHPTPTPTNKRRPDPDPDPDPDPVRLAPGRLPASPRFV